jgi:hypothetical protein
VTPKTFRQLVRDAQDEGLHVVVDSDAMAIRLISDEKYNNHRADIRGCGVKRRLFRKSRQHWQHGHVMKEGL